MWALLLTENSPIDQNNDLVVATSVQIKRVRTSTVKLTYIYSTPLKLLHFAQRFPRPGFSQEFIASGGRTVAHQHRQLNVNTQIKAHVRQLNANAFGTRSGLCNSQAFSMGAGAFW